MTPIDTIKARNEAIGHHFFSKETMNYFRSRASAVTFGNYFVTSEKYMDEARLYTVRYQNEDGTIETVGEFQQYTTMKSALRVAEKLHQASLATN